MDTESEKTEKKEKDPRLVQLQDRLKKVIGPRLKQARVDVSASQPELLQVLKQHGLERTQGSISQIEKGLRLPSLEMLYVMLTFYKASANYVLGLSTSPTSPADIEEELAEARGEGRLSKAMDALPKEKQEQVMEYAEFLQGSYQRATHIRQIDDADLAARVYLNDAKTPYEQGAQSDVAALSALLKVMERRLGKDGLEEALEEVAQEAPEWKELALAARSSKETGVQGG